MNRNRMLVALTFALILGLAASAFVYRQFKQVASVKPVLTRDVVVAAMPLPLGTTLQPQHVRLVQWPANNILPGMFTKPEDCANRALLTSVVENAPILDPNLASREAGGGLAAILPQGMRALSVRVDDVVSVAGFVLPGTMVDVVVTGQPPGGSQSITHTILERIHVIAAGQRVEQDQQGKPQTVSVITLMVTPEQADALAMASAQGRIQLALRNASDTTITKPTPFLQAALYTGAAPPRVPVSQPRPRRVAPPASPPPPTVFVMEIITGSKRESSSFPSQ